jgi:hypothetical protein
MKTILKRFEKIYLFLGRFAGFFIWTVVFLAVFYKALVIFDPDLGWRIAAGEIYHNQGMPQSDPFSYTMPSFPWVDHAWGYSLVVALIYFHFGTLGLAVFGTLSFFAALAAALYLIYPKIKCIDTDKILRAKLGILGTIPALLLVGVLFSPFSVRAQVVGWVFFAIILKITLDKKLYLKVRFALPFFFALWANLHGSFLSGLFVLGVVVFFRSLSLKRLVLSDLFIFFGSVFSVVLNPYGIGVYKEVFSSVMDSSLRFRISEWMPAFFGLNPSFVFLFPLSTVLLWHARKKLTIETIFLFVFFLIQALLSRRHIPLWAMIASFVTMESMCHFYESLKKTAKLRFEVVYACAYFVSFFIFFSQIYTGVKDAPFLSLDKFYPVEAVQYLNETKSEGRLFSEYGWGGYLILFNGQESVFIDGRMPSWRRESSPAGEEKDAFSLYIEMLEGKKDFGEAAEKYDIRKVLWPKPRDIGKTSLMEIKLSEFLYKALNREKPSFSFTDYLLESGWAIIYEDENSLIFAKE